MKKTGKSRNYSSFKYLVIIKWSEEDGVFVATVPELTGCATHGNSFDKAASHAKDAIATWLDGAKEAGIEIPEPVCTKKFSGKFNLRVPAEVHRNLAIKAQEKHVSLNSFAVDLIEKGLAADG